MARIWDSGVRRLAAGVSVVVAVLVLTTTPASAHGNSVTHGVDTATIVSGHFSITVCDREDDNHGVVAQIDVRGQTIERGDSFGGGCSYYLLLFLRGDPANWRLCERTVTCTTSRSV